MSKQLYVCTERVRDKSGKIVEYVIENMEVYDKRVKPEELKEAIRSGKIEVKNLTLSSDNRLIYSKAMEKAVAKRLEDNKNNSIKSIKELRDRIKNQIAWDADILTEQLFLNLNYTGEIKLISINKDDAEEYMGFEAVNKKVYINNRPVLLMVLDIMREGKMVFAVRDSETHKILYYKVIEYTMGIKLDEFREYHIKMFANELKKRITIR